MATAVGRGLVAGSCALALGGSIAGGSVLVATTIQDDLCQRARAAVSVVAANVRLHCDGRNVSVVVPDTASRLPALAAVAQVPGIDEVDWMIHVRGDPAAAQRARAQVVDAPEPPWPVVVPFGGGKAGLSKAARHALVPLVRYLKANPKVAVRAVGYTDNGLDKEARSSLGMLRAVTVLRHLNDEGVAAGSVRIASRGAANPVASNKSEAGRAKNRRVEIELTKES